MAAVDMLSQIGVTVLESIVVNELCEFKGRDNLTKTDVIVTPLVRTTSVDAIPRRRYFFCCDCCETGT